MEPALPSKKKETLLETIVSTLFSVLFFFLYLKPDLLAIYQRGSEPTPMLVSSSAKGLMFGFLLFSLIAFLISLIKLIRKRWGTPLVWFNCINELSGALYFAFFMTRWDALNQEFLRFFRNDLATWALIAKAAVVCFLLLTLISIFDDLYKAYKHS
ncbi:MAG TPA: hypothetical protein DCG32_10735 [Sphaerochaeta sp.]|jgi:uncharacterized membrane protein (DUF485 family)|nr:hypothetical protein [Sphaerochaeta sp.]